MELKEFANWIIMDRGLSPSAANVYCSAVRTIAKATARGDTFDPDAILRCIEALPHYRRSSFRTGWRKFVEFAREAHGIELPGGEPGVRGRRAVRDAEGDSLILAFVRCFRDPAEALRARWGRWALTQTHATFNGLSGQVPRPLLDAMRERLALGRPLDALSGSYVLADPRNPEREMRWEDLVFTMQAANQSGTPPWSITAEELQLYAARVEAESNERLAKLGWPAAPSAPVPLAVDPHAQLAADLFAAAEAPEPPPKPGVVTAGDYLDALRAGRTDVAPTGQRLVSDRQAKELEVDSE